MKYSEYRPPELLAPFVECLWFASDSAAPAVGAPSERILPDGCLEWIFHLGAPYRRWMPDGRAVLQPRSFVVGELSRYLLLQPTGAVATMGVRFRPGGAYRFLPMPLSELTDAQVPAAEVWGAGGREIEDRVLAARGAERRRRLVEEFLACRLTAAAPRPRLESAVADILRSGGRARVSGIADRLRWSTRQLEREFRAGVGLAPKELARIIRFQNLLRLAGEGALRDWAGLAFEGGYADQPHLVREFRGFAGVTPGAFGVAALGDLAGSFLSPGRLDTLLGPPRTE